jgi:PGAP1-like protein
MKHLVLIHGRSQQMKNSTELKKTWVQALKTGLDDARLSLALDDSKIHFPYYGDTLIAMMDGDRDVPEIVVKGVSDASGPEQAFSMEVFREMLEQNGVTNEQIELELAEGDAIRVVAKKGPLNWPWVLAGLRVLDRSKRAGAWAVSTFTHDVYVYLTDDDIREEINDGVRKAMRDEPTVVIAHSLGTIVAYTLLKSAEANAWKVPTLITLGSPLAVAAVAARIRPLDRPACVGAWYNGRDNRDTVALFPLAPKKFPVEPITAKNDIHNTSDNHHGIESYLADPDVARWIYDALKDS